MLYKLDGKTIDTFAAETEAGMGFHWGQDQQGQLYAVICGLVAIHIQAWRQAETGGPRPDWTAPGLAAEDAEAKFLAWLANRTPIRLAPAAPPPPGSPVTPTPAGPVAAPPAAATAPYGHLMFHAQTAADDVFYRWEAFPSSLRIKRGASPAAPGSIAPGTFAAPASELPFMPTGFAAVARCALPNPFPACFRWELQPVAGTPILCGASVPLFGQSGGGVEVMFPRGSAAANIATRGPIANPVRIPPL